MWTSTVFLHSLHRTAQHQWNLHSHWVTRVTRVVSYPRPQHMISQPSVPLEVLLQTRPAVPREPELRKRGENQITSVLATMGIFILLRRHKKQSLLLKMYPLTKIIIHCPLAQAHLFPPLKLPRGCSFTCCAFITSAHCHVLSNCTSG